MISWSVGIAPSASKGESTKNPTHKPKKFEHDESKNVAQSHLSGTATGDHLVCSKT